MSDSNRRCSKSRCLNLLESLRQLGKSGEPNRFGKCSDLLYNSRLRALHFQTLHLGIVAAILSLAGLTFGQDTPDFFRQNCLSCHTIGGGRLTGPDLKNLADRQEREWLIGFMMDPRGTLASGDPYAQKLFEEARKVPMPNLPGMTRQRCENLLDLIEAESKLEESQFKGIQVSNEPFTDEDRSQGRAIFLGTHRLTKGGTSCISCHSVNGLPGLGGGQLGPDLTKVYERLKGRRSLSAWLSAPGTQTMAPIFKSHPLQSEEIHSLVAYFEELAAKQPATAAVSRVTLLMLSLVLSSAIVLALDSLWKDRFGSVRRTLVDEANAKTLGKSGKT